MTPDMNERRQDMLSRSEFLSVSGELRDDIKQVLEYQRQTNSKVSTAFERLARLEERTETFRDGAARNISYASIGLTILIFVVNFMKGLK